jgi:NAD(P)-dependent dehydrogenase (short-subunit alcohol dehydrogenase family)
MSRRVLISGASTGIGATIALRLAERGWEVLAGVRRPEDGERLEARAGGRVRWLRLDVTDADQIAAAAAEVEGGTGEWGLAALVNNAGIVIPGPFETLPVDDLRRQLEVNLIGHVAVTQALLPSLRRSRGRIVFMGSIGGRVGQPYISAYTASKHALEAVADALRVELAMWGIKVSLIEPGSVKSEIWRKSAAYFDDLFQRLPEDSQELYRTPVERVRAVARLQERGAVPATRVARAVTHALEAPRPRSRYLVGPEAWTLAAFRVLPDRLRDAIVVRALRLPRAQGDATPR